MVTFQYCRCNFLRLACLLIPICQATAAQNLIKNGDFEAQNTDFSSDYRYGRTDTATGYHEVVRNPKDSHALGGSFGDHTTGTGWMLVANGAANTNLAIWRQSVVVATNTSFEFSGWAASWGNANGNTGQDPNPARIRVSINEIAIGASLHLGKSNGEWLNFGGRWNSREKTNAVIEVRLETAASNGNDPAFDDFSLTSFPLVVEVEHVVNICWLSVPGELYQVEYESILTGHEWVQLGSPVDGNGSTNCVLDTVTLPQRFYRVQEMGRQ